MTTRDDWKKYTKPSDETFLTVCLGDLAMSNISDGDKAVVDAAIRVVKREAVLRERLAKMVEKFRNHHVETPCCGNSEWRGKLCTLHQGIEMVLDEIEALLKEGAPLPEAGARSS